MRELTALKALHVGNVLLSNDSLLEQMPHAAWTHPCFQFKTAEHLADAANGKDWLAPSLLISQTVTPYGGKEPYTQTEIAPICPNGKGLPYPDLAFHHVALAVLRNAKGEADTFQLQSVSALFIELEPYGKNLWRLENAKIAAGLDAIKGEPGKVLHEWNRIATASDHRKTSSLIVEDRVVIHGDNGVSWTHIGKLTPEILSDNTPIFVQIITVAKPAVQADNTKRYHVLHFASDAAIKNALASKKAW